MAGSSNAHEAHEAYLRIMAARELDPKKQAWIDELHDAMHRPLTDEELAHGQRIWEEATARRDRLVALRAKTHSMVIARHGPATQDRGREDRDGKA